MRKLPVVLLLIAWSSIACGDKAKVSPNDIARPLTFNGDTLQNVADPVNSQDVATKAYVLAHGGASASGPNGSVQVAESGNLGHFTGFTYDGTDYNLTTGFDGSITMKIPGTGSAYVDALHLYLGSDNVTSQVVIGHWSNTSASSTRQIGPLFIEQLNGNAAHLDLTQGDSAAVSAANHARIRYNVSTQLPEISINGADYGEILSVVPDADGSLTPGVKFPYLPNSTNPYLITAPSAPPSSNQDGTSFYLTASSADGTGQGGQGGFVGGDSYAGRAGDALIAAGATTNGTAGNVVLQHGIVSGIGSGTVGNIQIGLSGAKPAADVFISGTGKTTHIYGLLAADQLATLSAGASIPGGQSLAWSGAGDGTISSSNNLNISVDSYIDVQGAQVRNVNGLYLANNSQIIFQDTPNTTIASDGSGNQVFTAANGAAQFLVGGGGGGMTFAGTNPSIQFGDPTSGMAQDFYIGPNFTPTGPARNIIMYSANAASGSGGAGGIYHIEGGDPDGAGTVGGVQLHGTGGSVRGDIAVGQLADTRNVGVTGNNQVVVSTAGGNCTLDSSGNYTCTGDAYASHYHGDGSALTGIIATSYSGVLPIVNGGTNSSASLNNNRVMKSSGGAIVEAAAITASRALISDANGIPTHSSVTSTELGYVSGVTSAIQTQLNAKQSTTLTSAHLLVGNGSNVAADVALSGDASITNAGAITVTAINGVAYSGDPLTQYLLLAGRGGGQTVQGTLNVGASSSDTLNVAANLKAGSGLVWNTTAAGSTTINIGSTTAPANANATGDKISINSPPGAASSTSTTAGPGGTVQIVLGPGGGNSSTGNAGFSGDFTLVFTAAGTATSGNGGAGGRVNANAGPGGTSVSGNAAPGGNWNGSGGAGGGSNGTGTSAGGGTWTGKGGGGGNGSGSVAGGSGATWTGGGGAGGGGTSTAAAGGGAAATLSGGGAGAANGGPGGAGGPVNVNGGNATGSGNNSGGAAAILAGSSTGTTNGASVNINPGTGATNGDINLGQTNTPANIRIGKSTTLIGMYGASPVGQASAIPAASGGGVQDAEARTELAAILSVLVNLGLVHP